MTNRRSFFKLLGLTAGAVATAGPAIAQQALPPVPKVKAKAAYITTQAGYDWQPVAHGLKSPLICAVAGDMKGRIIHAEIEPVDLSQCKIRIPRPRRTFSSWFTKKDNSQLYRLIVYIPLGLDATTPTYANARIRKSS